MADDIDGIVWRDHLARHKAEPAVSPIPTSNAPTITTITDQVILAKLDTLTAKVDLLLANVNRTDAPVASAPAPGQLSPKVQAIVARHSVGLPRDVQRAVLREATILSLEGQPEEEIIRRIETGTPSADVEAVLVQV